MIASGGREEFDRELSHLEAQVVLLGGLVERAIITSLRSLTAYDVALAQKVIIDDDIIDEKRHQIEEDSVGLLRREAPVASDLRRIFTILQIAGELERIGDYAEGIAKIAIMLTDRPRLPEVIELPPMGERAVTMLKRSLEAFLDRNNAAAASKAFGVGPDDEAVDRMYTQIQAELLQLMKQAPDNIEAGTYLMWAGHNVERIADRATNIAERVIYQATGRHLRVGDPNDDAESPI